ncbi:MAG: stage V sporulation protein S [Caldilineaceae bacterium]|nr:stage V sporulation protein S [Caldilineaceae bacterium]
MNTNVLRVAADSRPYLVAGAIAGQIREDGHSVIQAIGMVAVYLMLKAVITAQSYLEDEGLHLACSIGYVNGDLVDQECKAVRMTVCIAPGQADSPTLVAA